MTAPPTRDDEGVLDPWVAAWLDEDPQRGVPFADLSPEILELARGSFAAEPAQPIDRVTDTDVDGIPVRIYEPDDEPTGLVVYFHGGGFCIGSIDIMDNVAREIAHAAGAALISVGYRLAPDHPYPAGLDDCEKVTRWAMTNAATFRVDPGRVAVAGESAGGNLSACVALRLRESGDAGALAGQVLLYPGTAGSRVTESMREFDGLVLSLESMRTFWDAYRDGRDLDDDPFAAPLSAPSLDGLPSALVILGGADLLRDEGRAYAERLVEAGVAVQELTLPGQPHGFLNFGFPAAHEAYAAVGAWLRAAFASH